MIIELAQGKEKADNSQTGQPHPVTSLRRVHFGTVKSTCSRMTPSKTAVENHRVKDPVVGVLRYSLFRQTIPFLDLLYIDEAYRNRGFGTQMMHEWETAMAIRGYKYVMTSTQADENAWKFYEKLGYHKVGGFFPPEQEVEEWMYLKRLGLSD